MKNKGTYWLNVVKGLGRLRHRLVLRLNLSTRQRTMEKDLVPPRPQGLASQCGRTDGVHTIIRHPVKDGWTYRREGQRMRPSDWKVRKGHARAIGVMTYLRDTRGIPWQLIVWPWGPGKDRQ